mgnify:CR=1 FL=1
MAEQNETKDSKAQGLLAEVADRIKGSGEAVRQRLVDAMVEKDLAQRVELLDKAFQKQFRASHRSPQGRSCGSGDVQRGRHRRDAVVHEGAPGGDQEGEGGARQARERAREGAHVERPLEAQERLMSALEEMSLARGRYRIVMMSCGYVENACTSWLIFSTHSGRFATAAEAVIELALDLYAKFEDEVLAPVYKSDCCRKQGDVAFCSTCGKRIMPKPFDGTEFMEYVTSLHNTTCDSYGESESTEKRDFSFWPWRAHELVDASKDEIVFIGENAERVILDALFEVRDDLRAKELESFDDEDWRTSTWARVRKTGTTE